MPKSQSSTITISLRVTWQRLRGQRARGNLKSKVQMIFSCPQVRTLTALPYWASAKRRCGFGYRERPDRDYRVFPNDSDVGRTSGPPTFSTPQVPTGSIPLRMWQSTVFQYARRILRRVDENVGGTLVSRPTQKLASKECASADALPDSDKRLATTNPTKGRAQSRVWKPSTTYD